MALMTAMLVTSVIMAAFSLLGGKSKKGKKGDDDPVVGSRYWGDAMDAHAYVSPRTAAVWTNRMFSGSEESFLFSHAPYATFPDDRYNIGDDRVNTARTTAFSVPFDATFTNWDAVPQIHKFNKIPTFTRGGGNTPKYPIHAPGVLTTAVNQAFMGFNAATFPSLVPVLSAIPGTVFHLMTAGPGYGDMVYWIRWRKTIDLGDTIGINPVAIIADLLLDQNKLEDINWESFAYTGKKLIEQHPYMWFHMAMGVRNHKDAVKDVMDKARVALKQEADGRIGLKLTGEIPAAGPAAFTVLDALTDLSEFSITMPSIDEAEVINEVRATFLAARFALESDVAKAVLPADQYANYLQWEAEHASELQHLDAAERLKNFPWFANSEVAYQEASGKIGQYQQFEGHLLEADAHAVNTGNIVLTGVRRQESYNLDFLAWPDDAKAYLEEVLVRSERPYAKGSVTGGMWLSDYTVGDIVRLSIRDDSAGVQFDKVFEVVEVTIGAYGEENVRLDLKENHTWYDALTPDPDGGDPDVTDPTLPDHEWGNEPEPTDPVIEVFSIKTYMHASSLLLRGFPVAHIEGGKESISLRQLEYYLVPSCAPDVPRDPDDMLAAETIDFGLNAKIITPFTLTKTAPGSLGDVTLEAMVLASQFAVLNDVKAVVAGMATDFSGTSPLLHDTAYVGHNYFMLSTATEAEPAGVSALFRATSITTFELDEALYLRIAGVYAVDIEANIDFPIGSILTLLPKTSAVSAYAYGPVPSNAMYPLTPQATIDPLLVRTVPRTSAAEIPWNMCACAEYDLPSFWLTTPSFDVAGTNTADEFSAGSGDTIIAHTLDDVLAVMFSAPDVTNLAVDTTLMGVTRAYRSHGLDLDTTPSAASLLATAVGPDMKSGITRLRTELRVYHNSTLVAVVTDNTDGLMKRFSLRQLGLNPAAGTVYTTSVTAHFALDSAALESALDLEPVTIEGPRVVYGPV